MGQPYESLPCQPSEWADLDWGYSMRDFQA